MAAEIVSETDWREIPSDEGYRINRSGDVQSRRLPGRGPRLGKVWRTMKVQINSSGYKAITIFGGRKSRLIHVLLMETFGPPKPPGAYCLHYNGDKLDNRLENLRWGDAKENTLDEKRLGRMQLGSGRQNAKLTESIVADIYKRIMAGEMVAEISEQLGVSRSTIFNFVVSRKKWQHVPRPEGFDEYWENHKIYQRRTKLRRMANAG